MLRKAFVFLVVLLCTLIPFSGFYLQNRGGGGVSVADQRTTTQPQGAILHRPDHAVTTNTTDAAITTDTTTSTTTATTATTTTTTSTKQPSSPAKKPSARARSLWDRLFGVAGGTQWKYPFDREDQLQSVDGFQYCSHLRGSYFDVDTPLDLDVMEALLSLQQEVAATPSNNNRTTNATATATTTSTSTSATNNAALLAYRRLRLASRVFSPTVEFDRIPAWQGRWRSQSSGSTNEISSILLRLFSPFADLPRALSPSSSPSSSPSTQSPSGRQPTRPGPRWTTIRLWGKERFASVVDLVARALFDYRIQYWDLEPLEKNRLSDVWRRVPVSDRSAKRFACYMSADGNNDWVRLTAPGPSYPISYVVGTSHSLPLSQPPTTGSASTPGSSARKLLRYVDGSVYFQRDVGYRKMDVALVRKEAREHGAVLAGRSMSTATTVVSSPALSGNAYSSRNHTAAAATATLVDSSPTEDPTRYPPQYHSVRPHRLAYLIMVHASYENTVHLVESLLDPFVTILIHVDAKAPALKRQLQQYLWKLSVDPRRIRIMDRSFTGLWGSHTLVQMELAGFFELLDMNADWEWVVNLSGKDYPLRYNDIVYEDLRRNYAGKSLIEFWPSWEGMCRNTRG